MKKGMSQRSKRNESYATNTCNIQNKLLTPAQSITITNVTIAKTKLIRITASQMLHSIQTLFGRIVEGVNNNNTIVAGIEQFKTCV